MISMPSSTYEFTGVKELNYGFSEYTKRQKPVRRTVLMKSNDIFERVEPSAENMTELQAK